MKNSIILFLTLSAFTTKAQFPQGSHFLYIFDYVMHKDYLSINHYLTTSGYDYESYRGSLITGVEGKYTNSEDSTSIWISFEKDIETLNFVYIYTTKERIQELKEYIENNLSLVEKPNDYCNCERMYSDDFWFYLFNGNNLELKKR